MVWALTANNQCIRRDEVDSPDEYKEILDYENKQLAQWEKIGGIPARFCNSRITKKERKIWEDGNSLYIYGKSGTGKTHRLCGLLYRIACEHIANRQYTPVTFRFYSFPLLLNQIKSFYGNPDKQGLSVLMDTIYTVPILALDDFATSKESEWMNEITFLIIDQRYQNNLPVFITSNVPIDELDKIYSQRIKTRVEIMFDIVEVKSQDEEWRLV